MIRKKQRSAKQRAWQAVKQQSPSGWGPTSEAVKAAKHAATVQQIQATRILVFARDSACRVTGLVGDDDAMHEDPSRAQTRGRPPEERFNTRICIRLNRRIHELVTDNKIEIVKVDPALGFDGPIRVIYKGLNP